MSKNPTNSHNAQELPPPPYKNAALASKRRMKDLLCRMTLEEKFAQMMCVWKEKAQKLVDQNGNFDRDKARVVFASNHGLGQVGRPSDAGSDPATPAEGRNARAMAELTNAIQNKASTIKMADELAARRATASGG